VAPGKEQLVSSKFVEEYNKQRVNSNLPIYLPDLPNPFSGLESKDKKFFFGKQFQVQGFMMTEKTVFKAMAQFGFPAWETSTGSKLIFCYRMGDLFVLTTGRAVDVIQPYVDTNFTQKVESWVKAQPQDLLHSSAVFHNREKSYDVLITLSMFSLVFKEQEVKVKPTADPPK